MRPTTPLWFLYELVWLIIAMPAAFCRLWFKGRNEPRYRKHWLERLALVQYPTIESKPIWVHAVSLGEIRAVTPLIKKLKQEYPKIPIVLTTTTPTGREAADKLPDCTCYFLPYDSAMILSHWFNRVSPRLVLIMETELWPNLFRIAHRREIPLFVVNARMSPHTFTNYLKFRPVFESLLNKLTAICAQSIPDVNRYQAVGASPAKITLTGNIKFDMALPADLDNQASTIKETVGNRKCLLLASTHEGEESSIIAALPQLFSKHPDLLVILVPRHPNRFDQVYDLVIEADLPVARRSQLEKVKPGTKIYLADTMGEMMPLIAVSDFVFVGGSFAPIGGHNTLEPASLQKPVLSGTQTFHFTEITQMLSEANGITIVNDASELVVVVDQLLNDPKSAKTLGHNAYRVYEENQGALERTLEMIRPFVVQQ